MPLSSAGLPRRRAWWKAYANTATGCTPHTPPPPLPYENDPEMYALLVNMYDCTQHHAFDDVFHRALPTIAFDHNENRKDK